MNNGVTSGNFATLANLQASKPNVNTKLSLNGFDYTIDAVNFGEGLVVNSLFANPVVGTATSLINSTLPVNTDDVRNVNGFTTNGDGGGAQWKATGNTITASQTPALTGNATLSDANGNEYELVIDSRIDVTSLGAGAGGDDALIVQIAINTNKFVIMPPTIAAYDFASGPVIIGDFGGLYSEGARVHGAAKGTGAGFIFSEATQNKTIVLPNLAFFDEAVVLKGCDLANIQIGNIAQCSSALVIDTVNATYPAVLDNNIRLQSMNDCDNGFVIKADNNSNVIQGNGFYCNFSVGVINSILFEAPGLTPNWDSNSFVFQAIDPTPTLTNATGLKNNSNSTLDRITWKVLDWFAGFATTAKFFESPVGVNSVDFFLKFADPIDNYDQFTISGTNNKIDCSISHGSSDTAIIASTTNNSRATWNSGSPVTANAIHCTFVVSALASGGIADFYLYSPFVDLNSQKLSFTPLALGGLSVTSLRYTGVQNEILLSLLNSTAGPITVNSDVIVRVGT